MFKLTTLFVIRWCAFVVALTAAGASHAQLQSETWNGTIPTTNLNSGDRMTGTGNWVHTNTLQVAFPKFNPTGRTLMGMNVSYGGAQGHTILVWRSAPSFAGVNANNQPIYSILGPGGQTLWANGSGDIFFNHTFTFTPSTPLVQSHTYPTLPVSSGPVAVPNGQWPSYIGTNGTAIVQLRVRQNAEVFPSNGSAGYRWEGAFAGNLQLEYLYMNDAVVSGSVDFGPYTGTVPTWGSIPTRFRLKLADGTVVASATVNLTPVNGIANYSLAVPAQFFNATQLAVDGPTWLVRSQPVEFGNGNVSGLEFVLPNGDVDKDGEIDPADLSLLSASFLSSLGEASYAVAADLDKDQEVGPADLAILSSSFGETDE